jgi:transposase
MRKRPLEGPSTMAAQMLDPEIVRHIGALVELGWGSKRIARELGVALRSVKRYRQRDAPVGKQIRPNARILDDAERALAIDLLDGPAAGNAVVVRRLLRERGIDVHVRTLQRALTAHRQLRVAAEVATVRFETAPAHQLQIDFGEQWVQIAGERVRVCFFVGVLGYSRRIYVRASLSQRHDDWREGLAGAFRQFGGVTQTVLIDRARALVDGEDADTGMVRIHPAFAAFCRDWGVGVRACRPYRARTKGKTESGVGYVKKNAIARLEFASFAALEAHLERWMLEADRRIHGTTHERPCDRFDRDERAALRALPAQPLPVRQRRVSRRVSTDCLVDIDTIRYSVPHRLVRRTVEVLVGDDEVVVFDGSIVVARHARSREPRACVLDVRHFDGLYRPHTIDERTTLAPLGRRLTDYAAVVGGAS